MTHAPELSVYMPAYNVERYVADAVGSILRQSFADFELIIIDDGSKDQTLPILKRLADGDKRIRLVSRPNAGVSATANEALSLCRGEFIARMDGDDIAMPDRLEKQVNYLRQHPECVVVGSRVLLIDDEGLPLYDMPDIAHGHAHIDSALLGGGWPMNQSACMYRKSALQKVGGYRTHLSLHEDHDLLLRLAEVGTLENLPEVLLHYRRHLSSITFREGSTSRQVLGKILAEARQRRGLPPSDGNHAGSDAADLSALARCRLWGWMSLKARHVPTARKYAWASLRAAPFSAESWKLLYCAVRGR